MKRHEIIGFIMADTGKIQCQERAEREAKAASITSCCGESTGSRYLKTKSITTGFRRHWQNDGQRELLRHGVSIRQASRITGISFGFVRKFATGS